MLFWHAAHGRVPLAPLTAYTCLRAASSASTADGAPLNTKRVEEFRNSTPEHKFISPTNKTCQRCRINSECPPARPDIVSTGTTARGSHPKLSSLYGAATIEPTCRKKIQKGIRPCARFWGSNQKGFLLEGKTIGFMGLQPEGFFVERKNNWHGGSTGHPATSHKQAKTETSRNKQHTCWPCQGGERCRSQPRRSRRLSC